MYSITSRNLAGKLVDTHLAVAKIGTVAYGRVQLLGCRTSGCLEDSIMQYAGVAATTGR